ncbi:hypothetical protein O181_047910 [Austropuccinia psidii MF-1]|uniref:Uncharacterized protein n=1 Tax=Austropuccinia psidii MF-1 TaxID=1389203 RepID=A0A9Q3HNN6_9BASI|nr:hypothetical protein [Austropuccinia psidii MF-1]
MPECVKLKPARGKGYTAGASCIISILMNDIEAKVNLNTGAFCTCLAQINPSLSPKLRHELIDVLYTYNNAFSSDNEPLGTINGHEVYITLNIDRLYPPVLRRPAYPASPRAREALEKHIQELIQLGLLRKVGHIEEIEVAKPIIIAWNNDESRMVGDCRALNTYTFSDRYPIGIIQETLTQLSKAKYITSMD